MYRLAIHWNYRFNSGEIQIIECATNTEADDLDEKFRSLGYLESQKIRDKDGYDISVKYIDKIIKLY